jgi:hypothetical protein
MKVQHLQACIALLSALALRAASRREGCCTQSWPGITEWSLVNKSTDSRPNAAGYTLCFIVDTLEFACAPSTFCDTRLLLADQPVAEDAIKILRHKTNCKINRLPCANGSLPLQHVPDFLLQPVPQHSQSRLSSAQSSSQLAGKAASATSSAACFRRQSSSLCGKRISPPYLFCPQFTQERECSCASQVC